MHLAFTQNFTQLTQLQSMPHPIKFFNVFYSFASHESRFLTKSSLKWAPTHAYMGRKDHSCSAPWTFPFKEPPFKSNEKAQADRMPSETAGANVRVLTAAFYFLMIAKFRSNQENKKNPVKSSPPPVNSSASSITTSHSIPPSLARKR